VIEGKLGERKKGVIVGLAPQKKRDASAGVKTPHNTSVAV
jgi:hypothetical protein